jgi:hypothetical protein
MAMSTMITLCKTGRCKPRIKLFVYILRVTLLRSLDDLLSVPLDLLVKSDETWCKAVLLCIQVYLEYISLALIHLLLRKGIDQVYAYSLLCEIF